MPNALSWAAVPLQPHSPRMGASSLLLLWFGDSRVGLSPSLVTSLALPIENVIVSRVSEKEQISFPSCGTQGQNKNRPCADRPWLKQSIHRGYDKQGAQPEVGVCSSVRRKAHELAPLVFSIPVGPRPSMQSALVPSPALVCRRFSHRLITTGSPVANP